MPDHNKQRFTSLLRRLIAFIGVIVPRRFRARFRKEWEAELEYREELLARWDRLDWRNKLELFWRSLGAFWDALLLQPQRLEDEMFQDLRYGFQALVKRPGVALLSVIILALGIGATTTVFSIVNTVLLRPLPFNNPDRVIAIWKRSTRENRDSVRLQAVEFLAFKNQSQVCEQLAAYDPNNFNLLTESGPVYVEGMRATSNLFSLLGVKPFLGRAFAPEEDQPGRNPTVILDYGFWQRHFGSSPDVIGKNITLLFSPRIGGASSPQSQTSYTVIGVLPSGFMMPGLTADLWVPLVFDHNNLNRRQGIFLNTVGRLKPGVALAQAQAEIDIIAKRLEQQFPDLNTGWGAYPVPITDETLGYVRPTLLLLFAGVFVLLLIACVDVANMLLARSRERGKEMAIRTAVGASRARLIRQLLTESALLSILGGGLGLALALWGTRLLVAASPAEIPRIREVSVNWLALGVTAAISILTGVLFGLAPAIYATKTDLNELLKEGARSSGGSRGSHRARMALIISEIAMALMLLIGAGLICKGFLSIWRADQGYDPRNVVTAQISLPIPKYSDVNQRTAFYAQTLEKVRALPGVQSAGVISLLPTIVNDNWAQVIVEGRPELPVGEIPRISYRSVSRGFFPALGIAILRGRDFVDGDLPNSQVVINESMSRQFWPNDDPVGKRIAIGLPQNQPNFITIIGVVKDVKQWVDAPAESTFYIPGARQPSMSLVIRATSDPLNLVSAIRKNVLDVDKDQPIHSVMTMEERISSTGPISQARFRTLLLAFFALSALALAGTGIYGVISYSVSQRTSEIGIRMALGAQRKDILKMILGESMFHTLLGVIIGLAGAFALTRLLSSLLFGISPTDTVIFTGAAALVILVSLFAIYVPARKAMSVDPLAALRRE